MNREEEFGQAALVAGSLIGLRSFKVLGNALTACTRMSVWQRGVNVAECYADPYTAAARSANSAIRQLLEQMTGRPMSPEPEPVEHVVASLNCTCGFYAYFDTDANPHHSQGNVLGLIEGTGHATVGSRGFRVEKARIVALIEPSALPYTGGYGPLGCLCDSCRMIYGPSSAQPSPPMVNLAAVATVYGDVPIFSTLAAALTEFPLTPMAPATKPEPPPEPDTWLPSGVWWWVGMSGSGSVYTAPVGEPPETAKERALRLRRERNTGPGDRYGIGDIRRKS